ncbi:MAG TPA: nucleotide-binding protein [Spirochaetia bacterium]|nr:MAG: nucleotide-binding protein [Spirochaetes bacterium GWB1_36_13]HCL56035.1 nucleotide-binding protein [Spirochaetia bacterium]
MGSSKLLKYLLDSNVFIYHLNGDPIATHFIQKFKNESSISRITFIEILSFEMSDQDFEKIKQLLESFHIFDLNSEISLQCVKNRRIRKIKIPDNIIASTAQENHLILVTRNIDDFKNLNLEILNIFDKKCF